MTQSFKKLVLMSALLAALVVSLGAYTRLSNAGLGCPDWPGCYGFLTVPNEAHELVSAQQQFPGSEVHQKKAWIEMIHRYFAGSLGLVVAAIFFMALRQPNYGASVRGLSTLLVVLIVFQALLGMWTVTMNLQPLIVMGHLLGGFTILSLLTLLWLRASQPATVVIPHATGLKVMTLVVLTVLVLQIALGGWLAANYAAPHCRGLPLCENGELFSLSSLFQLPHSSASYEFGVLPFETRLSIHLVHRLWAMVTLTAILALCWRLYLRIPDTQVRPVILLPAILVLCQVLLGGAIVHWQFPLLLTLFHNVMAALLLLSMVRVCYLLFYQSRG
ncbi:COX15/CtaA family protein [Pseudoalteromonas ardens]|uniref:Cytochrome B561 n=1 Tax=Pseudoalteromonas rubra TaxID=43658 RepID=A0A0L0EXZ5_9GAMM|nr:COX15/CtaA family protein [Pseudoalteromonas sp. R96]KNC68683.1 cytochrome B561 [Pseudoalteromonas rubra]MDK1314348.1 COX15/CtaA family protein [Pseudoalteromonas sp. R96]